MSGIINWQLIQDLSTKPHPDLLAVELPANVHVGVAEVLTDTRTALHLLDLGGIPRGTGYGVNIDARVCLAVTELGELRDRLERIADFHSRITAKDGTFDDYCRECGDPHPCETRRLADGTYAQEEVTP